MQTAPTTTNRSCQLGDAELFYRVLQGVAELLAALPADDDGQCTAERTVEFNHQEPNLLALLTRRDG